MHNTHVNSLLAQFQNMLQRIAQLERWTSGDISTPTCLWLPGLFNPTAFLTAVMQVRVACWAVKERKRDRSGKYTQNIFTFTYRPRR